jgi:hypothetical protein
MRQDMLKLRKDLGEKGVAMRAAKIITDEVFHE